MRVFLPVLMLLAAVAGIADAGEIVLPASPLERDHPVTARYRFAKPETGTGMLSIEWTDSYGRLVERHRLPFRLKSQSDIDFVLDMRRAVAAQNKLTVRVTFNGDTRSGTKDPHNESAEATFITKPAVPLWSDYRIIMWQERSAAQYEALKRIGINGGMVLASRVDPAAGVLPAQAETLLASDLPWYVENIATDFYSPYHRWYPGRPLNWLFDAAKRLHRDKPADLAAFMRSPSLSDPEWLRKIRNRLIDIVRLFHPYRPLFYNLADEPGIAETAAFWDFDFSRSSLEGMRRWLRRHYDTLASLNAEWGTRFAAWDAVMPMTTTEAMRRADDNFSPWADFKAWMDIAFARAVRVGTDAVHAADPDAYAALEGGQVPGWGGYDYALLAHAVDLMELYDSGGNLEILHSLNPKLVTLTTSFRSGPAEEHRVWRELLRGSRGLVLWDDKSAFVEADARLGPRGRAAAPYFAQIRDGIGALLIHSVQRLPPVAILYSPASMRTQWMLDHRAEGAAWADQDSVPDIKDDAVRAATRRFSWMIEHLGIARRFTSPREIESGWLRRSGIRVLILPHVIALSAAAAAEITRFAEAGGTVIADNDPGAFDEHSRRLPRPSLASLFAGADQDGAGVPVGRGIAVHLVPGTADDAGAPIGAAGEEAFRRMATILQSGDVAPAVALVQASGAPVTDVQTRVFRNGDVTIVALLRDLPDSSGGSPIAETGERVALSLPGRLYAYDLLAKRPMGAARRLPLTLAAASPTLLALSSKPLLAPAIVGPSHLRLGETASLKIAVAPNGAVHVFHVDVAGPAGDALPRYSGNLIAPGGHATAILPIALNDRPGRWAVRVTDALTGLDRSMTIEVAPAVAHKGGA